MEFLKGFSKRMKSVGRYAVLMNNSFQKTTWKQYGIESIDEQVNMIFTVLLFVMEHSLREDDCTIDDIAGFIGQINDLYYHREYSYDDQKSLADFIINVILGNSGSAMYFEAYDYEKKENTSIHISYIANRIVYKEGGVRRTSYYLTDDGYNMVLSTMELESNLKLTVHEMLFKLHLEKADYARAVDDIKNVFERLRIQNQKIHEAMHRIKQNALSYSVEEYQQIVEENISTIERTREEFNIHKEVVDKRVKEFEQQEINVESLSKKDKENLANLRTIGNYLKRSLDEHQRILNDHFDLKTLYDMELENYSNMTMIQRYNFRSEIYDRVIQDAGLIEKTEKLLTPLLWNSVEKIYNPGLAFEYQRRIRKTKDDEEGMELWDDEEDLQEEKEKIIRERLRKYHDSLNIIMGYVVKEGEISLKQLSENINQDTKNVLLPTAEIFREIMIEFLTEGHIDIGELRKEQHDYMDDKAESFQLNEMLLKVIDENNYRQIKKIHVMRAREKATVYFDDILDEDGSRRRVKCSDVELWVEL